MATISPQAPVAAESQIEKTPGVCGGSACIRSTRIPVWSLLSWRRQGVSDQRLLDMFPALNQQDLNAAWNYVNVHHDEVEKDIEENEEA